MPPRFSAYGSGQAVFGVTWQFQGNGSSIRLTGWSAVRVRTLPRRASGSIPFSFAASVRDRIPHAHAPPRSDPANDRSFRLGKDLHASHYERDYAALLIMVRRRVEPASSPGAPGESRRAGRSPQALEIDRQQLRLRGNAELAIDVAAMNLDGSGRDAEPKTD